LNEGNETADINKMNEPKVAPPLIQSPDEGFQLVDILVGSVLILPDVMRSLSPAAVVITPSAALRAGGQRPHKGASSEQEKGEYEYAGRVSNKALRRD